jgi:Tfp pilus assembly protein PilZ
MTKRDIAEDDNALTKRLIQAVAKLSPQRKQMLDELLKEWDRMDYREDSRIPCFLPVDYSTNDRVYQDFINNLSQGGIFIETLSPFRAGQSIALIFSLPAMQKTFKIAGEIVRTEPDGIGVKFSTKLTSYQKELIHNAMSRK